MNYSLEKKESFQIVKESKMVLIFLLGAAALLLFVTACDQQESSTAIPPTPSAVQQQIATSTAPPDQTSANPTDAAVNSTTVPEPTSPPDATASEQSLSLEEFYDESYWRLLSRNPELISSIGLADALGTGNDQLTDISDEYIRETQALETETLDQLLSYDRSALTPEEQISYDIYQWYLEDLVGGHQWMYHDYPLTHFITSVNYDLELFMTDLHPVTNKQEAQDYITRLSQVETKFSQLLGGVQRREDIGGLPSKMIIDLTIGSLRNIALRMPTLTPYYTSFTGKVEQLEGISEVEKDELLAAAEEAVASSVIPGYQAAIDYLVDVRSIATDDDGAWKLPDGRDYYAYTLRHHTTSDMSPAEIHQLGLEELERTQGEIRTLASVLGYSEDLPLRQLYAQAEADAGYLSGQDIVAGYEALIAQAEEGILPAFDILPEADVVVVGGNQGAFYVQPSVDGSRPGSFYARATGTESKLRMPSLAYHEAVPGHHTQIAIAREIQGQPSFRNGVDFNGYVEGWALYAERLASDLGFYDDDPYGDLGRLQFEAWRAARLMVDTGIHDLGWTYDEAVDFMADNTGLIRPIVESEVGRYIVYPGQAPAYMVGMLKILELRQQAMDALGDDFELAEFHNVVLGNGSMPLGILEQVVEQYIQENLG